MSIDAISLHLKVTSETIKNIVGKRMNEDFVTNKIKAEIIELYIACGYTQTMLCTKFFLKQKIISEIVHQYMYIRNPYFKQYEVLLESKMNNQI